MKKDERITPHTFIIPAFHSHSKISCLNFPAINWDCRVLTGKTRYNVCPTWGKENRYICKFYSFFERSNAFDAISEHTKCRTHGKTLPKTVHNIIILCLYHIYGYVYEIVTH